MMADMVEYPVVACFDMPVDHHLFFLAEEGVHPSITNYENSIVAVAPGFAAVNTGIAMGDVRLTIEIHQQSPPVSAAEWEEVVEVTVEATAGRVVVTALDDMAPLYPILTPQGPGYYRVRVHARGRDNAIDLVVEAPVEDYLIQVWPASPSPQKIHKQTDRYGAEWVLSASQQDS